MWPPRLAISMAASPAMALTWPRSGIGANWYVPCTGSPSTASSSPSPSVTVTVSSAADQAPGASSKRCGSGVSQCLPVIARKPRGWARSSSCRWCHAAQSASNVLRSMSWTVIATPFSLAYRGQSRSGRAYSARGNRRQAVKRQLGSDEDHGQDDDGRTEDGQADGADEQADDRGQARSPGRGRADLPGDDVVGALRAEADRGERDQRGEDAGQRAAEHHERGHGDRGARLPPDDGAGEHADAAAPADHGLRPDGPQGQADPDGGERAPVAERGQAGRARRQVQGTAAEAGLPLPGA